MSHMQHRDPTRIRKPERRQFTVRLQVPLLLALRAAAVEEDRSITAIVERALRKELGVSPKSGPLPDGSYEIRA